jgi:membrane associated rhomboid family serine protease
LASKTLWEAFAHTAAFTDLPAGVEVAWQAHLLGALLGVLAASARRFPLQRASHG